MIDPPRLTGDETYYARTARQIAAGHGHYAPHYGAWADGLETYAAWYKEHEEPELTDAAFVAKDAFELPLRGFRERFGPPESE